MTDRIKALDIHGEPNSDLVWQVSGTGTLEIPSDEWCGAEMLTLTNLNRKCEDRYVLSSGFTENPNRSIYSDKWLTTEIFLPLLETTTWKRFQENRSLFQHYICPKHLSVIPEEIIENLIFSGFNSGNDKYEYKFIIQHLNSPSLLPDYRECKEGDDFFDMVGRGGCDTSSLLQYIRVRMMMELLDEDPVDPIHKLHQFALLVFKTSRPSLLYVDTQDMFKVDGPHLVKALWHSLRRIDLL